MRSTPVSAKARTLSSVTPPEISNTARLFPAASLRRTASRRVARSILSSSTMRAPFASASPSWARVSTSISTNFAFAPARAAACSAALTPPAAAMWFSLIRMAS